MHRQAIIDVMVTISLVLFCAAGAGATQEKTAPASVEDAFDKFARAVKDDKFDDVLKHIAPPGDRVWGNVTAAQTAAAKYEAALNQKFGKADERSILESFRQPKMAERYYEARGTIREVKAMGKDRAVVTVWTKGPRLGDDADRIYERKVTAVNVDAQWKFQLPPPVAEGSPVVKKVKRTGPDGKDVEVYAEHDPKGSPDQKNWEELKPSSYEGAEEELKLTAELYAKFAELFATQMEQVQKGSYQTRKEALDSLEKALRQQAEKTIKERQKEEPPPKPPAFAVPNGWQKIEAAPLASARFQIKEQDRIATVVVLATPKDGGGLAPNVNRWRAQLGLDALTEKDALKSMQPVKVDGIPGHLLDLTGPDAPDKGSQRIRAVIVTRGDQTWFFKLMGPASLVGDQASSFDGFIKSVRFEK